MTCASHQSCRSLANDSEGDEWMQKSNREEIRPIFTMRAQPKAAYLPCSSDLRGRVGGCGNLWPFGKETGDHYCLRGTEDI